MSNLELTGTPPEREDETEPFRLPRPVNILFGIYNFVALTAASIWSQELATVKPFLFVSALVGGAVSLWGRPLSRG